MKKTLTIVFGVLGVILVLALIGGGMFRFGYTRGLVDSPAIAEQMQTWQSQAPAAPAPYFYRGFYAPYSPIGHFGFHPLRGVFGFLVFAALFFFVMRILFFRRMMHHRAWGHRPFCAYPPDPQAPPSAPSAGQSQS